MSLISWHSSRLKRVARLSSAAETQAASGDDEVVCIRLCLKEHLFGQLHLQNMANGNTTNSRCSGGGCRGVHDASWFEGQEALRRLLPNKVS